MEKKEQRHIYIHKKGKKKSVYKRQKRQKIRERREKRRSIFFCFASSFIVEPFPKRSLKVQWVNSSTPWGRPTFC